MGINQATLLGRVGQDLELKHTPSGTAVCNFSLAVSKKWKDKSGAMQEKTDWINIVAWARQAELCTEYLKKGSKALIIGEISTRTWDDKQGNKRYTTEVVMSQIEFVGSTGASQNQAPGANTQKAKTAGESIVGFNSEDIPF